MLPTFFAGLAFGIGLTLAGLFLWAISFGEPVEDDPYQIANGDSFPIIERN